MINERTIPELRCQAVCGSANNQLASVEDGERLAEAHVLYAPDYAASAGGVLNIAEELSPLGYDEHRASGRIESIATTMTAIFDLAEREGLTTAAAADRVALRRLADAVASAR